MTIRDWLAAGVRGTFLEGPARAFRSRLFPPSPAERLKRRARRYDRETLEVMERVLGDDSNTVDVGAHVGDLLRHMVRLAPRGHHLAFEPLPEYARGLDEAFRDQPNVTIHRVALSNRRGKTTFQWVRSNPAYSGFRRHEYPRPEEDVVEIEVDVVRLDDVVPPGQRVDFLKIDVEGAELEVLEGARRLLRESSPIIVFEHGRPAVSYGIDPTSLYDLLHTEAGLEVSLMERWLDGRPAFDRGTFVRERWEGPDFYFIAYPPRLTPRSRRS